MAGSARGRTRNRRAWRQTISSANLYDRRRGFAATVRRKSFSSKEKQKWLIREKKTKAKGKNRKRPSLIQRKNENWKKKRRNKCPVLFGDLKSSTEVVCQLLEETIQTVANGGLTLHTLMQSRPPFDLHQDLVVGSSEPRLWIKGCNSQFHSRSDGPWLFAQNWNQFRFTYPSHTFNSRQVYILISYLQFPITGIPTNILMTLVVPTVPLFGGSLYW